MAAKRNFHELEFVQDTESPASKKLKLSKEKRRHGGLRGGSMNFKLPKSLFTELNEHAGESGYPIIYVFFIGSLLCSNFFGKSFLQRLYKIDIWKVVWIPAIDVDTDFDIYKRALLGLVRLFSSDEKIKIQMLLKQKNYYLQEFLDIIRHDTEIQLFYFLKDLKFGGKINVAIPIGAVSLIAQFADGGGFLKENFYDILLFEPSEWNEYKFRKFLTLMGFNRNTIFLFYRNPIFMNVENMSILNEKEFNILLNDEKLHNLQNIRKFNNDLKIYNENGKESSDLPDDACEHKYCKPAKIDDEQERMAIHWYQYLQYHVT